MCYAKPINNSLICRETHNSSVKAVGSILTQTAFLLSLIGFFSTADPDNANQPKDRQYFTYTLMGNTAGLPFIIDVSALNSTQSLNYEAQSFWNITVRSMDSGNPQLSFVKTFQISVAGKLIIE